MNTNIYELEFLKKYILNLSNEDKNILGDDKQEIYEEHTINKHGKERTVYTLSGEKGRRLAELQKSLTDKYLSGIKLPYPVKGYVKGESYRTFLSEHIGNKYFLRLDISSFFETINTEKFNKEFTNIIRINDNEEKEKAMKLIEDICFYKGVLPQGACSSPAMSNIIFSRTDQRILKYCQKLGVRYTRYADDLLFSSRDLDFGKFKQFIKKIRYILSDVGYKLNYSKMVYSINGELNLNGYILNEIEVRLSRKRFKKIRSVINTVNHVLKINKEKLSELILKANRKFIFYKPLKNNNKWKGVRFYYIEINNKKHLSHFRYLYVPADELILIVVKYSMENNGQVDEEKLELIKHKGNWDYPKYNFTSMNSLSSYLLGQRSYLISWISGQDTHSQKRIKKTIDQIEQTIDKIESIYNN